MIAIHDIGDPTDQSRAAGHPAEPVATPAQLLRSHLPGQHVAPDGAGICVVPALSSDMRKLAEKSQSLARVEEWLSRAGAWGNALVTGGIAQHLVATMNALEGPLSPAFIVGFLAPVQLSTTNADGVFVVATKDSPPKLTYFEGRQYLVDRQTLVRQDCSHTGTLQIFLRLESDAILWLKNGKKETL